MVQFYTNVEYFKIIIHKMCSLVFRKRNTEDDDDDDRERKEVNIYIYSLSSSSVQSSFDQINIYSLYLEEAL